MKSLGAIPLTAKYLAYAPDVMEPSAPSPRGLQAGSYSTHPRATRLVLSLRERMQPVPGDAYDEWERAGLTDQEIEAARSAEATDPVEAAALKLAESILEERGQASEDMLIAAREAGIDQARLLEIFLLVANSLTTNYFNRFVGLTDADFRPMNRSAA